MKYVVAIPSYKRSLLLSQKTLKMLSTGSVPSSCIYVFVANQLEAEEYKRSTSVKIVVGELGISQQRNFIANYFPRNTLVVSIDDDVEGIYKKKGEGLEKIENVDMFFKAAFKQCMNAGLFLWGVYPVFNAFYMKHSITIDLRFILGTLFGFVSRPGDKSLKLSLETATKEDFEQTILYFIKDGGVMRFNDVGLKTKFFNPNGGLGGLEARFEKSELAAKALGEKYPSYGYLWKRKNGLAEFRLNRNA
jgi:hypothetical protein